MRCIFMDIGGKRMLDLIYSHHKRTVAEWLAALPNKDAVRIINIDMARPYRDVVRAILPNAIIVVDKFHIQRTANKALDKVRRRMGSMWRYFAVDLAQAEYHCSADLLTAAMDAALALGRK
jgi:transposase